MYDKRCILLNMRRGQLVINQNKPIHLPTFEAKRSTITNIQLGLTYIVIIQFKLLFTAVRTTDQEINLPVAFAGLQIVF